MVPNPAQPSGYGNQNAGPAHVLDVWANPVGVQEGWKPPFDEIWNLPAVPGERSAQAGVRQWPPGLLESVYEAAVA